MAQRNFWKSIPTPVKVFALGGVAVLILIVLRPAPAPRPSQESPLPEVPVTAARPQSRALTVHTQGTVAPRRQIELVAEVGGRIVSVSEHFADGAFFEAGQVLVQIEPRDYELALIRAKARVAEAEQALATEKARAGQAKREWRDLGDEDANALFLRKPQLAAARAQWEAARAERDQAELNLARTRIAAPFAGRVRNKQADLGRYLTPGTVVATVFDVAAVEIRLPLTDRQAALLDLPFHGNGKRGDDEAKPGPAVIVRGRVAGREQQWRGRITRIEAALDSRSRLYYAVAEVEEPFRSENGRAPLMVGLFVEAEIEGRELNDVVTLPESVLFKRDQLFTLDDRNRLRRKTVEVLGRNGGHVWVRGELDNGERVVLDKQGYLTAGREVIPKTAGSNRGAGRDE